MLPHRISPRSVSVLIDGRFRVVSNETINYEAIVDALRNNADEQVVRDLIDIPAFVKRATFGRVEIVDDEVHFNGALVTNYMATRILAHLHAGIDIGPYARFLDNLMDNPTEYVREDLFKWVEAGDMPFTEDGCFLAYKYVQEDYYSAHAGKNGKVFHGLGEFVTMPRSECDLSRTSCSTGLHFCSYKYLGDYMTNRRIIIVKVHPSNVTAIPPDYGMQKGRCCAYTVVGELSREEVKDILNGKLVVRSFKQFDLSDIAQGDDELLNAPVKVGEFEPRVDPELSLGIGAAVFEEDVGDTDADADLIEDAEDDGEYDEVSPYAVENAVADLFDAGPVDNDSVEDLMPVIAPNPAVQASIAKPQKASKPKAGKPTEFTTKTGVTVKAKVLVKAVEELGQRGAAKKLNVPRTSIQEWLKALK